MELILRIDRYLAITNMDLALRKEKLAALTSQSTAADWASGEELEPSNRVCLMIMKYTMKKLIRQSIPETDNARTSLIYVGEKFKTFDKAHKG